MEDALKIILFNNDDEEVSLPLSDYLALRKNRNHQWEPSIEEAGFQLRASGKEWVSQTIYPGQLNLIILEWEAAYEKLVHGHEALIHFGEYGGEGGSYILITPQDNILDLSVIFLPDPEYDGILPIEGVIGNPKILYSHVQENRDNLLPSDKQVENVYFKHLQLSRKNLLESIKKETQNGRALFELMGWELNKRLYM